MSDIDLIDVTQYARFVEALVAANNAELTTTERRPLNLRLPTCYEPEAVVLLLEELLFDDELAKEYRAALKSAVPEQHRSVIFLHWFFFMKSDDAMYERIAQSGFAKFSDQQLVELALSDVFEGCCIKLQEIRDKSPEKLGQWHWDANPVHIEE